MLKMLKKQPFVNYRLEDEEKTSDIVNVRMNDEDRATLNAFKELIGSNMDSTALKLALYYSLNVIQQEFSGSIGIKLFKKRVQKQQ